MARCGAPRTPPAPVIARRSSEWRQVASVKHVRDDLVHKRKNEGVYEVYREEGKREGENREAGVAGGGPELENYRRRCCGSSSLHTGGLAANRLGFLGREGEDEEGFL